MLFNNYIEYILLELHVYPLPSVMLNVLRGAIQVLCNAFFGKCYQLPLMEIM